VDGFIGHHPAAGTPVDEDDSLAGRGGSRAWRTLRRDPAAWVGGGLASAIVALTILAPVIAPHDPLHQYRELMPLDGSLLPPGGQFLLGTDNLGRDYLSRLLHAGRATLLVGLGANLIAIAVGTLVGLVAAYSGTPTVGFRGRKVGIPVEGSLMRVTDIGLAFPALLLAIALTAVFHPSLEIVAIVIAAVLWAGTARLVYARTLVLRESDFVLAAVAVGSRPPRIVRRHLLPHLLPLIVVIGAAGIAVTVLFEATLSFLGAGAPVDTPTWGRMLAETRSYYQTDLRLPLLPGLAIFFTVFAFTLLGDALSDALDPHAWQR